MSDPTPSRPRQRFVVLGDPHISPGELWLWDRVIGDINALKPDAVLVLGDLTGHPVMGTSEGLDLAVSVLDQLDAPWCSIIGNHDLEAKEFATDADAVDCFVRRMGRSTPWFSRDLGAITVIGLSNTQWRDNPANPNELVVNPRQLQWWRDELTRLPDRPVLVLGHAPPVGSGLLTLGELHGQVGNAFMNHNHFPSEVQRVIHEHPNVLFWFSGHNHMGQHYRDAITLRQGVHYIHTGVVSRVYSRDGQRHSRVLELSEDAVTVRTFDHAQRRFDEALTHREPFNLDALLDYRRAILGQRMVPRNPDTMRQGPGTMRSSRTIRFALLCPTHGGDADSDEYQLQVDRCRQQIKSRAVDRLVLINPTAQGNAFAPPENLLDQLVLNDLPIDYLTCGPDGRPWKIDRDRYGNVQPVAGCRSGGGDWPSHVFLLRMANAGDTSPLEDLMSHWPEQGNVLILADFSPRLVEGADALLAVPRSNPKVWWISGHPNLEVSANHADEGESIDAKADEKSADSPFAMLILDWDEHGLLKRVP